MKWNHHQPLFWLLFAAGGMLTAFITPAMVLLIGITTPLEILTTDSLSYGRAAAFYQNWLGKLIILIVIALPLWHCVHRIFKGLHDVGIPTGAVSKLATYGVAALATLTTLVLLVR